MKQHRLLFHTIGLLVLIGSPSSVWAFHTWKRIHLQNGMTLLAVEKPGIPAVSLTLLIARGSTSDPPDKRGLATLTGRLLTKGTHQRSGEQTDQRIAGLGGKFVEDVSFDYTTLDLAVLKEDLPAALDLLADVVQHPSFPEAEVERMRAVAERQAMPEETPRDLVMRHLFAPGLYGDSPLGEVSSLQRIARDDIVRFHHQTYRPDKTVLAAAGDLTIEELEALAKKYFADWSAPEKTKEIFPVVFIRKEPVVLVINRSLVEASVQLVFGGAPAASATAPAVLLLSHLLGGGAESRLEQRLREQKRWTYDVWSTAEPFLRTGLFCIKMSVPYEVILPALQETLREIARLQTESVSAPELARAKQELTTRFYFKTENVRELSYFLAQHEASTQGRGRPDDVVDAINSVTADEVRQVARIYLDPRRAVVTVEGDPQAIGKYAPTLAREQAVVMSSSRSHSPARMWYPPLWAILRESSGVKPGAVP